MVKHTQTIRRQIAAELFECVRPFCEIGVERVNSKNLDSEVTLNSTEELITKKSVKYLGNDILDFCTQLPPLRLPPMLTQL